MGEPPWPLGKTCYFCGWRDAAGVAMSWTGKLAFPVCRPCNDIANQLAAEAEAETEVEKRAKE